MNDRAFELNFGSGDLYDPAPERCSNCDAELVDPPPGDYRGQVCPNDCDDEYPGWYYDGGDWYEEEEDA